ncbi:type II toxin-antitoxin system VapC family toxin [Gordonia sp. X0973]|uniref:type II toxin-antitoxin system VapC family toxin n=1 Tax=Gordonia sp. X0973 TaxID=2742602 RepID=UPI0026574686|nr:type II toxin-antitoxin system VapC family toxin [Gordonia sp. X0973]
MVLDASVVVELLLNLPLAEDVRRRIAASTVQLHAPQLLTIEVLQVLRRRVAAGSTTTEEANRALELFEELDVSYHDHALLARRVWALRGNLTAYDAAYVALAELLDVPLLTADAGLAGAPGNQAQIELVSAAVPDRMP